MKIKLWTIQDEKGWNELQSKGVLIPKEEYVNPDFKQGYDWLRLQMNQRIGVPNHKNQYPVWAWYQYFDANKRKPDLRESGFLPRGTVGYRLEIEKEAKDILLSDFELWHTPLCFRRYIANSEKELNQFNNSYQSIAHSDLPKSVQHKVEKSWEKIFDMNFDVEYFTSSFKEKMIQATFWELHQSDIIKVDKFIAR